VCSSDLRLLFHPSPSCSTEIRPDLCYIPIHSTMAFSKAAFLSALLLAACNSADAFAVSSSNRQIAVMVRQSQSLFSSLTENIDGAIAEGDGDDIENPPAEDYIVNVGDLEGADDEDGIEDDGEPPAWYSSAQRVQELRVQHRRHETDTGSPEYQVAGMTERISYLTKHLKMHSKDFSTRRGLVALVNKRRRLLNFLYAEDVDRYNAIIASLGVRHKTPGNVADRNEQYGRFPAQKAEKVHLKKK